MTSFQDRSRPMWAIVSALDRFHELAGADRAAINALPLRTDTIAANQLLVREGERPESCCMLLEGYACRYKTTSGGQRQIVSFHIPGDLLDAQHLELDRADHNVQTITPAKVAWVSKRDIEELLDEHPAIRKAIMRSVFVDASIFREWVLNVGRREAIARVAHLLCEFAARREAAELGTPDHFKLPMSQEEIGDATGLTPVHVNRMLQTLGAQGIIRRNRREVWIVDWDGLRKTADFDSTYLHLEVASTVTHCRAALNGAVSPSGRAL